MQLLSIADNMTDAEALLAGDAGNPNNGRQGVAGVLRDRWRDGGRIEQWHVLTPQGLRSVFGEPATSPGVLLSRSQRLVLFDPQRQYVDRLSLLRSMHGSSAPIVTMAHSIGYGPSAFRIQSDAFWEPRVGDVQVFPSSAAREAATLLENEIMRLSGRTERLRRRIVVPYGINDPLPPSTTSQGFGGDGYLLTVGRLDTREKFDFQSYARAAGRIAAEVGAERMPTVVIAGRERDAGNTAAITQMFEDHAPGVELAIVRDVSEAEKWNLYWNARALVHPTNSHAESFGLTLGEAASVGLPLVATKFSGQPEAVHGYRNAYWVRGAWPPAAFDEDVLAQYGFGAGGAIDVDGLTKGVRWALLSAGRLEGSGQFVDSAAFADRVADVLESALEARGAVDAVASPLGPSRFADAFIGYWDQW